MRPWLSAVSLGLLPIVCGILVNRTIDDQLGDPITGIMPNYIPTNGWAQGAVCEGCFAAADPSQAFDGTWHDATHHPGDAEPREISMQFKGTAVYAYCILANANSFTTLTNLAFTLDGAQVGTFTHNPTGSPDFQYNVSVYSNSSLPDALHVFTLEASGNASSLVLFDYLEYTTNEATETSTSLPGFAASTPITPILSSPSPSSSRPRHLVDAIVGGVIGGIALLVAVLIALLLYRRSARHKKASAPAKLITPFKVNAPDAPTSATPPSSRYAATPLFSLSSLDFPNTQTRSSTTASKREGNLSTSASGTGTSAGAHSPPTSGTQTKRSMRKQELGQMLRQTTESLLAQAMRQQALEQEVLELRQAIAGLQPEANGGTQSLRNSASSSTGAVVARSSVHKGRDNAADAAQAKAGRRQVLEKEVQELQQTIVSLQPETHGVTSPSETSPSSSTGAVISSEPLPREAHNQPDASQAEAGRHRPPRSLRPLPSPPSSAVTS